MVRRVVVVLVSGLLVVAGLAGVQVVARARSVAAGAGRFVSVAPSRVLDTKTGLGAAAPGALGAARLAVLGVGHVPASGVIAVVLTVTVSAPSAGGYLTVYPDGTSRPVISNVNFSAGHAQADQVYAPIGTDGKIALYNGSHGSVRLLGDVSGYFADAPTRPAGAFVAAAPTRVLDTRYGFGGRVLAGRSTFALPVLGRGPVPGSGVSAVALTLTALSPRSSGYLSAYADGTPRPGTSNLDFAAHQAIGNLVLAPVGSDGKIAIYNGSAASTQLVADVEGYFLAGAARAPGTYVPLTPSRVLSEFPQAARGTARGLSRGDIPPDAAAASVLNITASGVTADGYATAYDVSTHPRVSSLSFTRGRVSAGLAVVSGDPNSVGIYNGSSGALRFTADLFGYYIAAAGLGSLTGKFTDATNGAGVGGVVVLVYFLVPVEQDFAVDEYARTTTAADGSYTLPNLYAGETYYSCFDALGATRPNPSTRYASQCYRGIVWNDPGGPTELGGVAPLDALSVTAGAPTTVDVRLSRIPVAVGMVTGRATNAGGAGLDGVEVTFRPHAVPGYGFTAAVQTSSSGDYSAQLPPGSYDVCFDPPHDPQAGAPNGYATICATHPVSVTIGSVQRLDEVIPANGTITGRVVTPSGAGIDFGHVRVYDGSGAYVTGAGMNASGDYTVPGLAPGHYTVCFSSDPTLNNPPYGYVDECYDNVVAQRDQSKPPAGTTPVTVTAAASTTLNATLAVGGAISGTVTRSGDGAGLAARVDVFDASHRTILASSFTDMTGRYIVAALAPSAAGYTVCIDPSTMDNAGHPYNPQCYRDVAWDGDTAHLPTGTTPATVTGNATHSGIDAVLTG